MQLADMIEKRRFVGREFLLLLWMESELFDATLHLEEHGSFGLWIEKKLILSFGPESTRITAPMPGLGREAKEALLRGQLPEAAGVRIAWKDDETSLAIKAESFALTGLKLQTVLDKAEGGEPGGDLVDDILGKKPRGKPKKKRDGDAGPADEEDDTAFYERMELTTELEGLLASLYREFLTLRLDARWESVVVPTLKKWVRRERIDVSAYRKARRITSTAKTATSAAPAKRRR